jgi:hypothetical protein
MPRKDPEKKREYDRMYREQHREQERQKALARYYANREEINAKRNAKLRQQRAELRQDQEAYAQYLEKRRIEHYKWRANNREHWLQYFRQFMAKKRNDPDWLESERERQRELKRRDRQVLSDSYLRNQAARHYLSTAKNFPEQLVPVVRVALQIRRKTNPNLLRSSK